MSRSGSPIREIPGAARYIEGAEERDFRSLGGIEPEVALASDDALAAFKEAIAEASEPPATATAG